MVKKTNIIKTLKELDTRASLYLLLSWIFALLFGVAFVYAYVYDKYGFLIT